MISRLNQLGKPFIVVLMHGAPVISPYSFTQVSTVISAGYLGQAAGLALWDVLTGAYNPAGRLSTTFYTGISQLPPMVNYNMTAYPGRTYRYLTTPPYYKFGYGKILKKK